MRQREIRRALMPAVFFLALIFMMMVRTSPASAALTRTGTYSKRWTATDGHGGKYPRQDWPGYFVTINSITKKKIRFQVSFYGWRGNPIYMTNIISGRIRNGKVTFRWHDSWYNQGTGTLKFSKKKNQIQIRMKQTKSAKRNRNSLETAFRKGASRNGFLTLRRTNGNRKVEWLF